MKEVIVVGGGASGMVAAIFAAREGYKVTILEHKDRLGKKILATGNGKCNYTNLVQEPSKYRSDNMEFVQRVLSRFDVSKTIEFFRELGIYPKDRNGYLYPNSEQASSILQVLEMELKKLHVEIHLSVHVEEIHKEKGKFKIITKEGNYFSERVILATGGCASKNLGSDGSGYKLAASFGHHIIKPLPALVQLVSKDKRLKTIQGVRCNGSVRLISNEKVVVEESGELLFANYGISGIPILQISRFAAKELDKRRNVSLIVDFLPDVEMEELKELLLERVKYSLGKTMEEMMIGLINQKLAFVLLKEGNISTNKPCKDVSHVELNKLAKQIKECRLSITDTNSFDQAQVTAGGIDTKEIHLKTLESKLVKGLFFTGELLDVDGTCGGYNLQWAWTSGYVAAQGLHVN